ncbi:EAL domain-containing protein [Caulobacter sp. 17J80-11]|uniref:flagella assembly cyclic-di-GMP phosphodiesterase TipF n=1 Tax=Caulobacter sp. 17J80-11 TaxID=2763502 RepID=UPI001653B063|nr:EAL domain-containing protein [Caulobacter sp. 17J80-11]MBC6980435.1 EAL domain-containing protein [Caulobacter sp. 17J80-11]
MRKFTTALLIGAYVSLSLTAAVSLWRAGVGWPAGVAVLAGALGLAFALHSWIAGALARQELENEIEAVRDAHRLLADALESTQGMLEQVAEKVERGDLGGAQALTSEVRVLEDLVHRMSEDMETKLSGIREVGRDTGSDPRLARHARQSSAVLETVREALADNRVDLYLQPIVSLPQRKTVFYESYSRLRDASGLVMPPSQWLPVAEPEGLIGAIDNLLLFRCVQIVRRLAKQDRKVAVFCNVSMTSLSDDTFFPQFLEFLNDHRDLSGALIFEVGQAAFDARGAAEARNMAKLAELGFRFSIDKVQTLDIDFRDLQRADVKFLKIGADVLLEELLEVDGQPALSSMKDIHAADFAALTRRYGIEIVAEKIENERQVPDVLDLDIAYGQGHLFGEPRAIKEQVLAETDPPVALLRPPARARRARG